MGISIKNGEQWELGFNTCKAQYDEVLKRVVVDEERIRIILNFLTEFKMEAKCEALAKAIANSPDVIKLEGEK